MTATKGAKKALAAILSRAHSAAQALLAGDAMVVDSAAAEAEQAGADNRQAAARQLEAELRAKIGQLQSELADEKAISAAASLAPQIRATRSR